MDISDLPSAPKDPPKVAATPHPAGNNSDDPAAAAKASTPATLVRKNPFDDPPETAAPSDQSAKLLSAKASLQQKVQSGTASDRDLKMLHALCKQLGDASCSN